MKNKIFIILTFLLLTGCTVQYDLNYEDNIFKENVLAQSKISEMCGENLCSNYLDDFYNSNIATSYSADSEELASGINLDKYNFYNKNIFNSKEFYGVKLGYEFSTDYKDSYVVKNLFNYITITDNMIKFFDIKDIFSIYPYLESINISFSTDKSVLKTNCDKKENNIYYWNINKDNYLNKIIEIEFKEEIVLNSSDVDEDENSDIIYYILGIIGIVLIISIVVIYEKIINSNK